MSECDALEGQRRPSMEASEQKAATVEPTGYAPSTFHAFPYATADAAWASLEAMAERRKAGSV